jgi:hypothetical protein
MTRISEMCLVAFYTTQTTLFLLVLANDLESIIFDMSQMAIFTLIMLAPHREHSLSQLRRPIKMRAKYKKSSRKVPDIFVLFKPQ